MLLGSLWLISLPPLQLQAQHCLLQAGVSAPCLGPRLASKELSACRVDNGCALGPRRPSCGEAADLPEAPRVAASRAAAHGATERLAINTQVRPSAGLTHSVGPAALSGSMRLLVTWPQGLAFVLPVPFAKGVRHKAVSRLGLWEHTAVPSLGWGVALRRQGLQPSGAPLPPAEAAGGWRLSSQQPAPRDGALRHRMNLTGEAHPQTF